MIVKIFEKKKQFIKRTSWEKTYKENASFKWNCYLQLFATKDSYRKDDV
jgi:hypothetical protein